MYVRIYLLRSDGRRSPVDGRSVQRANFTFVSLFPFLHYSRNTLRSSSTRLQDTMAPEFTGGSLSFKGDKKKGKKKKSKTKHSLKDNERALARLDEETPSQPLDVDDDLTDAERKALEKKRQREREELKQVAKKTHRERVEEFNEKLGNLTELNDIPRVSIFICIQ
jgi:protein FAM32A